MKYMYVYILLCSDKSYYTGVSNHPERRESQHNAGEDKTAYTFTRRPVKLVYVTEFWIPLQAIAFEKQVKGWSRKKKEALINERWDLLPGLSECKNGSHYRNRLCS
jgi:putative endonuclease